MADIFSSKNLLKRKKFIFCALVCVLVVIGAVFWWRSTFRESTDDAQIDGHINPVSSRVTGHVARIDFKDYQYVEAGALLVEIDPADYRVAVERARAEYADAQANAEAARTGVPITSVTARSGIASAKANVSYAKAGVSAAEKQLQAAQARLREDEANNVRDQADLARNRPLVGRGVISQQQYEQAVAAAAASAATVDAARALVTAAREQSKQALGRLKQARAELDSAQTGPQQVSVVRSHADSAQAAVKLNKAALDHAGRRLSDGEG